MVVVQLTSLPRHYITRSQLTSRTDRYLGVIFRLSKSCILRLRLVVSTKLICSPTCLHSVRCLTLRLTIMVLQGSLRVLHRPIVLFRTVDLSVWTIWCIPPGRTCLVLRGVSLRRCVRSVNVFPLRVLVLSSWCSLSLLLVPPKVQLLSSVPTQSFALLVTTGRRLCVPTLATSVVVCLPKLIMSKDVLGGRTLIRRRGMVVSLLVAGPVALTPTPPQMSTELLETTLFRNRPVTLTV